MPPHQHHCLSPPRKKRMSSPPPPDRVNAEHAPPPRCEMCKKSKVKCDRGQPSCSRCSRSGAACCYRERKKPGLRAGYGKELEQRFDKVEEILRSHCNALHSSIGLSNAKSHTDDHADEESFSPSTNNNSQIVDLSGPSDTAPSFKSLESISAPQAEAALFLEKPLGFIPNPGSDAYAGYSGPCVDNCFQFQGNMSEKTDCLMTDAQPLYPAQIYYGLMNQGHVQLPEAWIPYVAEGPTSNQEMPPYESLLTSGFVF